VLETDGGDRKFANYAAVIARDAVFPKGAVSNSFEG